MAEKKNKAFRGDLSHEKGRVGRKPIPDDLRAKNRTITLTDAFWGELNTRSKEMGYKGRVEFIVATCREKMDNMDTQKLEIEAIEDIKSVLKNLENRRKHKDELGKS